MVRKVESQVELGVRHLVVVRWAESREVGSDIVKIQRVRRLRNRIGMGELLTRSMMGGLMGSTAMALCCS